MKTICYYTIIGLVLFLNIHIGRAAKESATRLLEKARKELYTNPQQAVYYATQARTAAVSPFQRAEAFYVYAQAEKLLGDFDGCVQALYKADDLLQQEKGEVELKGHIYNLMSVAYCNLGDYSKAIALSDKAISFFKVQRDSLSLAACYNNRGIIHYHVNEYQQATRFLEQALTINRSAQNLKSIASNLNNLCLFEGDIHKQLEWINEAIVINKNLNATWSLGENYNNLGQLYYYARKYSEAIAALEKAHQLALSIGAKGIICDNYEYAAKVYSAIGNYKTAYENQVALYNLSKEIQSENKLRTVEQDIAQDKLLAQQQKEELQELEYKTRLLRRNIIILLTVSVSLVTIGFLLLQRFKRKKKVQLLHARYQLEQSEHEVAKLKMQKQEMELENIQHALESSKLEATNFALFLQSRNELLDKIQEMIRQGYRMENQELIPHLKKINAFIGQYQANNKTGSVTLQTINDKTREFLSHLSDRHPNLTQGEKYLASMLRVNLSTKEIAMLTGNTPKTINMNRYRLRKALGLSAEADLVAYIQSV